MKIPIQVEPANGSVADVKYRWDADTEILSAQLHHSGSATGMSGSVELEGVDGSWLILEVTAGQISGVEVAVWPEVHKRGMLGPPARVEEGRVIVPSRKSQSELASVEVETALLAEADEAERVFHFMLGRSRQTRTVRLAKDLLVDLDAASNLAGVWLLNVPPFVANVG